MHPLWFYKHQHDNRVRSRLSVPCQRWWFQWRFADILVNCAPSGEMHNYCTPHIIKENFEDFLIHQCNYTLLFQVYSVWQVVKTETIIFNNSVFLFHFLLWTGASESIFNKLSSYNFLLYFSFSEANFSVPITNILPTHLRRFHYCSVFCFFFILSFLYLE